MKDRLGFLFRIIPDNIEFSSDYEYDRIVTMSYSGTSSEHSAMADELGRLPFVESVGYSWQYPVWGYWGNPVVDREKQEILFWH